MKPLFKSITRRTCVKCGDMATGFIDTKPYCTYHYNLKIKKDSIQKERDKRRIKLGKVLI